jgi:peptidoglycan/xylan/chitin deacetylase (PgdA/CDA1 family)
MRPSTRRIVLAVTLAALAASPLDAAPRKLYLTFDADMTPGMLRRLRAGQVSSWYDPAIVDYLRERRVPAAVFVSGLFAEAYPDLVHRLAADPLFTVGAHGYRHAAYTSNCYGLPALTSDAKKRDDIVKARDTLAKIAGRAPLLFRYPGLCHDAHDDELVRQAGLRIDQPDIISGDSFNRNVKAIVQQVLKQAKDGGTVIFHFGGPNAPATLEALKQVVPLLEGRGYVFAAK